MVCCRFKANIPKYITEDNANFTDIFAGVLEKFKKDEDANPTYVEIVSSAVDFFNERIPKKENPIKVLEKALEKDSPFIPGTSIISIPIKNGIKNDDWSKAFYTNFFIEVGNNEISSNRVTWQRIFGQIPSACLIVANERGFEPFITIPSFKNRYPNYLEKVYVNYLPEELKVGTVLIDGGVGDFCGKHSKGGVIAVLGSCGKNPGDCSENVNYYIKGWAEKPTQVRNCNFYLGGSFLGEDGLSSKLHEHEIEKLHKNNCEVNDFLFHENQKFPENADKNLLKKIRDEIIVL